MNPVGKALGLSALMMLVAAIVVGVALEPLWGLLLALVAVVDLVLAILLGRGAIGASSSGGVADHESVAEPDPGLGTLSDGTPIRADENPLIRED